MIGSLNVDARETRTLESESISTASNRNVVSTFLLLFKKLMMDPDKLEHSPTCATDADARDGGCMSVVKKEGTEKPVKIHDITYQSERRFVLQGREPHDQNTQIAHPQKIWSHPNFILTERVEFGPRENSVPTETAFQPIPHAFSGGSTVTRHLTSRSDHI